MSGPHSEKKEIEELKELVFLGESFWGRDLLVTHNFTQFFVACQRERYEKENNLQKV